MKNNKPKCEENIKKQCLSEYGSYACKLRYFNDRCIMALKEKAKEKNKGSK